MHFVLVRCLFAELAGIAILCTFGIAAAVEAAGRLTRSEN